jgi:DNA-binding CsgD family transcriptional regulator/DNA polymerase III delta prime subunit
LSRAIVGRTDEIHIVERVLDDETEQPRALLIEGEPGIGKTTLFDGLLPMAGERGFLVLTCRPTRSEMDLSYVGLLELLQRVDEEAIASLPPPQVRVLNLILRREEPEGSFDRLSLGVAVQACLRALASAAPLLVAIDDAQWLDHPTLRTLVYALRRLAGTRTRVAVVRRSGDVRGWPLELDRAMTEDRLDIIRLGPVDTSALSRILRTTLGWAPAWPQMLRIAELSGGNPFTALELARAFGGEHAGEHLDALPSGGAVDLARSRIGELAAPIRAAVELASVPRSPTIDLLRRLSPAASGLRPDLARAERAGVLELDGDRVRFAHPILAAAVYDSIPPPRRRELHRAVALLSDDLEERARHLAAAAEQPDAEVAMALEGAAEQAWRRGAPDAAARLLGMACRLTPPEDEEALALRRVAYGRLLHSAGDAPAAIEELGSLAGSLAPGLIRARALYHLMYVTRLSGALGRAVEHGLQAAQDAADDPSFQAEVYELLSRLSDDDIERKLETARRGSEAIERLSDPDPEVAFYVRAALVEAEFYAGLGIHLERLEGLTPETKPRFPPVRTASRGDDLIGRLLAYDGRIDEGISVLRAMYERASVESRSIMPAILGWMAEAEIMGGRFAHAAELAREGIERAEETGTVGGNPWEVGFHAVALAQLGNLDDAGSAATKVVETAEHDPSVGPDQWPARLALGVVAMARGRPGDAAAHLLILDRSKRDAGVREPRLCAHAGDLIEALIEAGALEDAADALDRLEEDAERSGGRWSRGVAARCRALLWAVRRRSDEALDAAERSLVELDGVGAPFERARTLLVTGQIHRRRREKRQARDALRAALAAFEELATPIWAQRSRAELARIPERGSGTELTPTEERIAQLAAGGLTNKEIADRTFLSPKTVEVNLTRVYRKLGVRSRTALAGRFADGRSQAEP